MPQPIPTSMIRTITGYQRRDCQAAALRTMGIPFRRNPLGHIIVIDSDLPVTMPDRESDDVELNLDAA